MNAQIKKTIYKNIKKYKNKRTLTVWTHTQYRAVWTLKKKNKKVKEVWTHKKMKRNKKKKRRIKISKIIKNSVNTQIIYIYIYIYFSDL